MTREELLKKLNMPDNGVENEDGQYVIDLDTYEDFGRIFSKLEKSDIAREMPDTSIINTHTTDVRYTTENDTVDESESDDDYFIISLLGDLDGENYKVVIDKID